MTNEQAIEVLNGHIKDSSVAYGTFTGQALRMAIEALKAQLSKEGTTSDTISRQAAINEIDEWIKAFLENGHKESAADACLIQDGIIQLPSAQPEIVRCKDCKYNVSSHKCLHPESFFLVPDDDFYCGYAERRTNATN